MVGGLGNARRAKRKLAESLEDDFVASKVVGNTTPERDHAAQRKMVRWMRLWRQCGTLAGVAFEF